MRQLPNLLNPERFTRQTMPVKVVRRHDLLVVQQWNHGPLLFNSPRLDSKLPTASASIGTSPLTSNWISCLPDNSPNSD